MPNPKQVRGSVKPHRHTGKMCGPHLFMLGKQSQPPIVTKWKGKVRIHIEQPHEDNNFSLIRILFLRPGTSKPPYKYHKAAFNRKKDGTVAIYLKKRYTDTLPHPLPVGPYVGTCVIGDGTTHYTFQASTLNKTAEPSKPKTIITPGDVEYDLTLARAKRTLSRTDGLGGGAVDASGLRHGKLPLRIPPGLGRKGMG